VVLKAGNPPAHDRHTSHTASLAGDYAFFHPSWPVRLVEGKNMLELVYFCQGLSAYQSPPRDIWPHTSSGGHGALALDLCMGMGLNVLRCT
jgi:acyl-CoA synthetase (NDP forming)